MLSKYTLRVESYQIPLTAGTTAYDLPETVRRIWSVEYVTSSASTDRTVLTQKDGEDMIAQGGSFLFQEGTPTQWYLWPNATKMQLGLWMTPDTDSSLVADPDTGFYYPDVELTVSKSQALTVNTELPEGTLNEDQYLAAMRLAFSVDNRRDEIAMWQALRDKAFQQLDVYMQNRKDTAQKFMPMAMGRRQRSVI